MKIGLHSTSLGELKSISTRHSIECRGIRLLPIPLIVRQLRASGCKERLYATTSDHGDGDARARRRPQR
jgi:hypothetical protein